MSLFTRNTQKARQRSASLESILSTAQPSTLGHDDQWVIFSPHASASESQSESSFEHINQADLSLPSHNGSGEFPEVPREFLMDRVSRWSTEQSRIVYEELQRLEHRFLWINSNVPQEPETQQSTSWRSIAQRVHSLIALDDDVLDILFGDGISTPKPTSPVLSRFNSPSPVDFGIPESAFTRSKRIHPNWDDKAVQRLLGDLGIPLAPNFGILRDVLSIGLAKQDKRPVYPLYTPPLTRDYWEDECSSLSTEIRA